MKFLIISVVILACVSIHEAREAEGQETVKPSSVSSFEATKNNLDERLTRMKGTVERSVKTLQEAGQSVVATQLSKLAEDIGNARSKLQKLNPGTTMGQAGIERLKGIMTRLEERINTRQSSSRKTETSSSSNSGNLQKAV